MSVEYIFSIAGVFTVAHMVAIWWLYGGYMVQNASNTLDQPDVDHRNV